MHMPRAGFRDLEHTEGCVHKKSNDVAPVQIATTLCETGQRVAQLSQFRFGKGLHESPRDDCVLSNRCSLSFDIQQVTATSSFCVDV